MSQPASQGPTLLSQDVSPTVVAWRRISSLGGFASASPLRMQLAAASISLLWRHLSCAEARIWQAALNWL